MIYNHSNTGKAQKHLEKLIGKGVRFELRELKEKRSNQQNRYLYLLLKVFANETGYTIEEAKTVLKRVIVPEVFCYNKQGYLFEKSTGHLTSNEMTQCIDKLRHFSSQELGIYLPIANEVPSEIIMDAMENELNHE
jgi:hypothetical protein